MRTAKLVTVMHVSPKVRAPSAMMLRRSPKPFAAYTTPNTYRTHVKDYT